VNTREDGAGAEVISDGSIQTYTGLYVYPLHLDAASVCIEDIAHGLSNLCRYAGHVRTFYSVAEHSCRVAELLWQRRHHDRLALWGLLHDASEAYLIDLPRPLKRAPGFGEIYRAAEARAMDAICDRFGMTVIEPAPVAWADTVLLLTEQRDLMPAGVSWAEGWELLPYPIVPMTPAEAELEFLALFDRLGGS
jgi:hypothetical protein